MPQTRPRLVAVPPNSKGLAEGLRKCLQSGSIVTAYDDARLRLASKVATPDEEVEFLAFGEVVSRVLRMQGEPVERVASRAQRLAITQLACRTLQGDSPLERSARFPGMARLVADNLERLRHFGVDPNVLRQITEQVPKTKAEKFRVLADIAVLVQDSMDAAKREYVTDRVLRSQEGKPLSGPIKHLVVIAGPDENPVFDGWVVWLAGQGVAVDVVIDLLPTRTDLFKGSQRSAARVRSKHLTVIGEPSWFEALFTGEVATTFPDIEIFNASDPLGESEWIMRRCAQAIDQGTPPGQIGVFLRDQDHYGPLLAAAAGFMDVPVSGSRSVPLLSCGLSNALVCMLKALSSHDLRKVARLAKSTYFSTEPDFEDRLWRTALDLRRASGDKWADLSGWVESQEDAPGWLRRAVEWRNSVAQGTVTLTVWLDRFRQFVGEAEIFESALVGDERVRSRDLRAQTVLQRTLADYAFVYDQAGHRELGFLDFVNLAVSTWEDETVLVEGEATGVKMLFDANAIEPLTVLFIPGMLEGTIPRRRREDPLLDDDDLAFLSSAVGWIIADSRETVEQERDRFVQLCAAADERLVFSYPQADDERENIPAYYLEELRRATGQKLPETIHPRSQWIPTAQECATEMDKRLRSAYDAVRLPSTTVHIKEDYAKATLRPDFEEGVTPAELASALTCPFAAAYRHRLRVFSPVRRTGTASLLDLPVKAKLAEATDKASGETSLRESLDDLLNRLSPHLENWETELLRTTGERLIQDWLEREFVARSIWPHNDVTTQADLGSHGLKNNIQVSGKTLRLKGTAPAVSSIQRYSAIQMFLPALPELDSLQTRIESDNQAFELGLHMLVQLKRGTEGVALEVDAVTGQRRLYVLPKSCNDSGIGLRSDVNKDVKTLTVGKLLRPALEAVVERLGQAMAVLERSSAQALPGDHCQQCPYGEICRVSSENGDFESPFGEDVT